MSKIGNVTTSSLAALRSKIEENIKGCICLEDAAQKHTSIMYEEFKDSIVLVRLFATVPFGELPAPNQKFITDLAASVGISSLVNDQMLVLSLLGTRGEEADWNNRHNSQGHVGIPLVSADFIDSIPMMSRLLKELGLGLDWIESGDTEIVTRTIGKMAGVFYVPDAKTTVDQKGRKIIAAQDFVSAYNVKTVFGIGGGYLTNNVFTTNIVFTRDMIEKQQAELFMPVANTFKTGTVSLASSKKIFAQ